MLELLYTIVTICITLEIMLGHELYIHRNKHNSMATKIN